MKFRDIQLITGGKQNEEQLRQNRYLMTYWDNVEVLFLLYLASNIEFLGMSKLNIKFGEFEGDRFIPPAKNGIAVYWRNDFSFEEFCELSYEQKNDVSLGYIEKSLFEICDRFNVPVATKDQFARSISKVRENGYEHTKEHKKTTKWHRSRKYRAVTLLHFKTGGIDATLNFVDKTGAVLASEKIIESRIWEAVWFDLWKGVWVDESFVITTRVGEVFFEAKLPSEMPT